MSASTILAGNWKMNLGPAKAQELIQQLSEIIPSLEHTQIWLAPAYVSLAVALESVRDSGIRVGSQNVHWEESGAFTGEVSREMLSEVGCSFALVGHSERRHIFGESIELCSKRALANLNADFPIIFCVGETLEERDQGRTEEVLQLQLSELLEKLSSSSAPIIFAYEPVWAIGTGKVASTAEIKEAHTSIGKLWGNRFDSTCPPILYGGSVKPSNFEEIISITEVSGALVGGASLDFEQFSALATIAEAHARSRRS